MNKIPLHITNGSVLTSFLDKLKIEGEKLTWEEMLCEGPTTEMIYSMQFLNLRKSFFKTFYNIELNSDEIIESLEKLNHTTSYSEIVLWFEYDLFCHINMVAVISLIKQKKIDLPIYLVCSGRVKGEKNLKGLAELSPEQLKQHYQDKTLLNTEDLDIATNVWRIYCGTDHNLLKPLIVKSSSFKYLSNCLKAHLERFPDSLDGLGILEKNILNLINTYKIKSKNHLLGYTLNYQGYFGYADIQLIRIIEKLSVFYTEKENCLELNRSGHMAIMDKHNFANEIDSHISYGGVKKYDFQFSKAKNKLIKPLNNAD